MNAHNCHCTTEYYGRLNPLAGQHRIAWRNALAGLASPFVRLHQLRNIRSRMLQEALGDLDKCKPEQPDA